MRRNPKRNNRCSVWVIIKKVESPRGVRLLGRSLNKVRYERRAKKESFELHLKETVGMLVLPGQNKYFQELT